MPKSAFTVILLVLLAAPYAPQADTVAPLAQVTAPAPPPASAPAPLPKGGGGGDTEPSRCLSDATIQVGANPANVQFGQASRLSWSVRLPDGCGAVQVRLNGQVVTTSGNRTVTPPRSTTFTVVVTETRLGQVAQRSASAEVNVVGYPTRVVIDSSTPDPVGVLIGALGSSNCTQVSDTCVQVVELCNVDLDFTGQSWIEVGANRWLIASPACARGPRSLGPRIVVTDHRASAALFVITGDKVRFSGFRLEGPTRGIGMGEDTTERGILISPPSGGADTKQTAPAIQSIAISNMEIFYWSGAGIEVSDNVDKLTQRGRLFNTNVGAVRVADNFIHHNRHGPGEGYGVAVSHGAYALIERNVFDENRHAITGSVSKNPDAADYTGYTARDNLILSGGGVHCDLLGCWHHTQQIDMHGDQNEWYSNSNWECGTAGETIINERNTVFYTNGLAIKIRGNPADKAVVDGNVFKHGSPSDAIAQNGGCGFGDNITKPVDIRPNNVFGADPMAQLGSCDFFGDGQEDQFMATGVTWWALSPTTHQWRYLNTMRERLPDVRVGKFDGDAVCDVALGRENPQFPALPRTYSKSGTGPWEDFIGTKHQ